MNGWTLDKKIAATITLLLLGLAYLAGVMKIGVSVGLSPSGIEKRYSAAQEHGDDLESFLEEAEPPVSFEKLTHITHAHLMPYAFLFAALSFFVTRLRWPLFLKTVFFISFGVSIVGDFAFMFLTRFAGSGFYVGLAASGLVFGICVAAAILGSLYELWLIGEDTL